MKCGLTSGIGAAVEKETKKGRIAETFTSTCQFDQARMFCFPQWKKETAPEKCNASPPFVNTL